MKNAMKIHFETRLLWLLKITSIAVVYAADILVIYFMVLRFENIGDWNAHEVLVLYAFFLLSYSICGNFFMNPFTRLPQYIKSGEFDSILTKPVNPLIFLMCKDVAAGYIPHITLSLIMFGTSFHALGLQMTFGKLVFLLLNLVGAAMVHASVFMFSGTAAFWMVQNRAVSNLLWQVKSFVHYPLSIYPRFIQFILTVLVPFAFINFYPAQHLLGKNDFLFFPSWLQYVTPLVGGFLFFLGYQFWNFSLKHYKSTGS